jgi:hypothetical protein
MQNSWQGLSENTPECKRRRRLYDCIRSVHAHGFLLTRRRCPYIDVKRLAAVVLCSIVGVLGYDGFDTCMRLREENV